MKSRSSIYTVWGILFFLHSYTQAQNQVTKHDTIYSNILQEKRAVIVMYPKNFIEGSSEKYDALYVLDGEWNTSLASTVYNFLAYAKFVPANMVVVGIPNPTKEDVNLRDRDFTPTHTPHSPVSGGADKFLSFIKNELIPYVSSTHPVRQEGSILYGTSLGGLFTLYAFLNEPALFKSYMTVEPSLWWDNYYLNKYAAKKLDNLKDLDNKTLWNASRDGNAYQHMGVSGLDSVLRAKAPSGLLWKSVGYPDETHFSAIWKGVYDGLKFSYTGHLLEGNILLNPANGIVVKGRPFKLSCFNQSVDSVMYYTLDGSSPTTQSEKMTREKMMTLTSNTSVTVKSFSPREEYNKTIQANFKTSEMLRPIPKPRGIKPGGLKYNLYEGQWTTSPDLKKLKPNQSGIAGKDFDAGKFSSKNFLLTLDGYVEIAEEGYYTVEMSNPTGTRVFLDDHMVIGHLKNVEFESFIIPLQKGIYPFRIEHFHKTGGNSLQPVYLKTEKAEYPIPTETLFSKN
jgi:predicted alpha/beta superfamily hydrolase